MRLQARDRNPTVKDLTCRVIDLVRADRKGPAALITAQPRTGKTVILQNIAKSITHNTRVLLIVLLIDERPEEVTDMQRTVKGR